MLDNGDFVHTRPECFAELGAEVGERVEAEGAARRLAFAEGRVIEVAQMDPVPRCPAR